MREGWKEYRLNELGFVGRGKSRHRPRNAEHLYGGRYPFVQTSDIKHANLYIKDYFQTYNEDGLEQSKMWEKGTLCITIAANIADVAILGIDACFPDSIIGFWADNEICETIFIKYYFDIYQKIFQQISQGAAQDNLSLEKIMGLKFKVPPLSTQRKIAAILSAYDDLIENNLKRIKLLEEMAQNTYEEWFVRFKFPGHENAVYDAEIGLLEGWEKVKLGDNIKFVKGKKVGELFEDNKEGTKKVLLIDALENGKYKYTKIGKHTRTKRGDLMMLMDGARSSHIFYSENGIIGSTMAKVLSQEIPPSLLYHFFRSTLGWLQINNTGAAIPHANKSFINSMNFIVPQKEILKLWSNKINTINDNIWNLKDQTQLLKEARDILLPRLITGMIDANAMLGASAEEIELYKESN